MEKKKVWLCSLVGLVADILALGAGIRTGTEYFFNFHLILKEALQFKFAFKRKNHFTFTLKEIR